MSTLRRKKSRNYSILNNISIGIFIVIIFSIHLPLGGERQWIWSSCLCLSLIAVAIYAIRMFLKKSLTIYKTPAYFLIIYFILCALFQLYYIPSNAGLFANNAKTWVDLSSSLSITTKSISLTPTYTLNYCYYFFLAFIVFFLTLNLFKTEKSFYLLIVLFISSIAINAFFGFYNQLDLLSESLFCPRPLSGYSINGTFVNRNHFSVLMEMGCCTSLGLFCATYFSKKKQYKTPLLLISFILFLFISIAGLFSFSRTGISLIILSIFIFTVFIIFKLKKINKIKHSIYLFISFGSILFFVSIREYYI